MGNCFPLFKLARSKYHENLETPAQKKEEIPLPSEDYISALKVWDSSSFIIGQETTLTLYNDFLNVASWSCSERVRSLDCSGNLLVTGGKYLELFEKSGKMLGSLKGHQRPVNTLSFCRELIASGGGDWTVRLWDLMKMTEICQNLTNWNVVTCMKWMDCNTIIQTSEDLRMRVWDVRDDHFENKVTVAGGDNFATCIDVKENYAVTGHRGFGGNGCEVKMWDLRKYEEVFTVRKHEMPVESVKFLDKGFSSCGKDGIVNVCDQTGKLVESWRHPEHKGLIAMENYKSGLLAATVEPKLMFFTTNPLTSQF